MRKAANLAILAASFFTGLSYALHGRWWIVLTCGLAAVLWLLQSRLDAGQTQVFGLLFFAAAGGAGAFLSYNAVWQITNLVVLLIAWDLDRFARDIQLFSTGGASDEDVPALFRDHLKRLGIVVLVGWGLGVVALNLRISLNLAAALILGALALFALRQVVRYLYQERSHEEA